MPFHAFPEPEALTGEEVESQLRSLGFGYRAKYIAKTAQIVASKPKGWLNSLRNPDNPAFPQTPILDSCGNDPVITYKAAHTELLQLAGVGPKVADCVCLMGLGWAEAVPIDTHVWQIAQRDYKFGKGKTKTFSLSMYDAVGDFFRELWGKEAGWAHSVLFTADLRTFSDRAVKKEDVAAAVVKIEETAQKTVIPKKRRRDSLKIDGAPDIKLSTRELLQDDNQKMQVRRSTRIRISTKIKP